MPAASSAHARHIIYLDNAATTPLCEEAAQAMRPYMTPGIEGTFGNANSLHAIGRDAFSALEEARASVTRALRAQRPDEIAFTSGATESDNAALIGIAVAAREKARLKGGLSTGGRIAITRIEHDAVLNATRLLKDLGFAIDFIDNDRNGRITPDTLAAALHDDTLLASVMTANNEVGTVQPVKKLAACAHEHGVLFHTDAVQALGKIEVDLSGSGVDAASFSAHKVRGPKGVGVLYLKAGTPFRPYMAGGGQERGLRSGTQNVAGAAGCAAAIARAVERREAYANVTKPVRDYLYTRLCELPKVAPSVSVEPGSDDFLPNIVNVCVKGCESQTLIMQLDMRGFCISGGSACSSNSLDPSHVLSALSIPRNLAQGSLRISLGEDASIQQADLFIEAFKEVVDAWS